MSKYIVQPGTKNYEYFVIQLTNGRAVKKLGPYVRSKAISVKNKYNEQEKATQEYRKAQLTAHHNLDKGEELSQAEAMRMMDEFRRKLKS